MARLHIRRLDNREIVKSIEVANNNPRHLERVMLGLLRNMNTDEYFIDDSEFGG